MKITGRFTAYSFEGKMERIRSSVICLSLGVLLFSNDPFAYAQGSEQDAEISVTPSAVFVGSRGDRAKFEEDHWIARDVSGGISDFSYLKEYKNGDSLEMGGKALAHTDDFSFNYDYERAGTGSLKASFKEFRKYYDGTGGFFSLFSPTAVSPNTSFRADKDLHLDIGDFKFEAASAGEDSPKCTFAYEREFKDGSKSMLDWGDVTGGGMSRKIYPSFQDIGEDVNKFKLGIEHNIKGVNLSAEQSWENATVKTKNIITQTKSLNTGALSAVRTQYNNLNYDLYSTVLGANKAWGEKVFSSLGVMYNRYIGGEVDSATDTDTTTANNQNYPQNPARILQDSVTILPNISFTPTKDLIIDAGTRGEFIVKDGSSNYDRDFETGVGGVNSPDGVPDEFVNITDETTDKKIAENFGIKYKGVRNAVFYTTADFQQEFFNVHDRQDTFGPDPQTDRFARITKSNYFDNHFTVGSKWYILSNLNITAEFRDKTDVREYKHILKDGNDAGMYRGFINTLDLTTYSPLVKLNYKPFRWLSCNFGYNYDTTVYGIRTFASSAVEINKYRAHVYSTDFTLSPVDCFYVSLFYQKQNAATRTRANGDGGSATVIPTYNANFDVVGLNWSYAATQNTSITGGYSMSRADNFNNFSLIGLPLGLNNLSQDISIGCEHKLTKNSSLGLKYSFMEYQEDSNNGITNYEAHVIYSDLMVRF